MVIKKIKYRVEAGTSFIREEDSIEKLLDRIERDIKFWERELNRFKGSIQLKTLIKDGKRAYLKTLIKDGKRAYKEVFNFKD